MLYFLMHCVLWYIGIVYGLIPLLCLIFAFFMLIGGMIAKAYYAIEDYFTKEKK